MPDPFAESLHPRSNTFVIDAVRKRLKEPTDATDRDLITAHVARVDVQAEKLAIKLVRKKQSESQ